MKQKLIKFLYSIPFINNYYSGIVTIFMLHRVDNFEEDKLYPNENMKVSPEFLENFIIELKNDGYEFISLDNLHEILQNQEKVNKKIVFTLDDGYKDNYTKAYPIFKKHNVPFTIYVTTSFPNKTAILWWYALEKLIIENIEIKINDKNFTCVTNEEKNRVFIEIRELILKLNQKDLLNELNSLFQNYTIDWYKFNDKLCMDWKDIKTLSKNNLCTIAGHTKNHYTFNRLDEKEIIDEIVGANKDIEEKIIKKIEHFAYPFGSINEVEAKELNITKKLNFKTVTTTRNGNIYLEHKNFKDCCLARIMLIENFNIQDIGKIRRRKFVTI
jgi:peptidoglycan/xylan/chitin deacetylase (PgdA/CDA1 family)